MEHLSITFPRELKRQLDEEARKTHSKRSTLIQHAVRVYLKLKQRKALTELLKEGYEEMSEISTQIMNDFRMLDQDSLKHVD